MRLDYATVRQLSVPASPELPAAELPGVVDLGNNSLCGDAVSDKSNIGLAADCNALLAAKDTLRGKGNLNWSSDRPIENWAGVELSGSPIRVTALNLYHEGLNGRIPVELSDLSNLQELSLRNNQLSGVIPAELGDLSNLQDLRLRGNDLSWCVPSALWNVPNNDLNRLGLKFCN